MKFKKNKELSLLGPQIENINRRPKVQNTRVAENSDESLTQRDEEVKTKFSRQRLSESWDEIRDMMNQYEVHDEVITAVEENIEKIKSRQLSRETAITEGLIPKYEEVLKVAREYTKGSDVSARELADVIVAIRKNGAAVLYDLDDIRTKKITDISLAMASESPQRSAETSVTGNITQDDIKVKKG